MRLDGIISKSGKVCLEMIVWMVGVLLFAGREMKGKNFRVLLMEGRRLRWWWFVVACERRWIATC